MKKYTKQILAFLLVLCMLMSIAMPTVFAVQGEDSITYTFYNADWKEEQISAHTAEIKAAYDAGTSNWRYEAASGAYQFPRTNRFASDYNSMQFVTSAGGWIAVRIKSPGAGRYDLTLTHGARAGGAPKGSVYIIDATVIDKALGENAAAYAETMSQDP